MKELIIFIALKAFGLIPLAVAQGFGKGLGWCAWKINKTARIVTQTNIDLCYPDKPIPWRNKLVKDSLMETGLKAAEMASVWNKPARYFLDKVQSVEGENLLEQAVEQKKGVVLIVPHLGNWEIANLFLSRNRTVAALYQPTTYGKVDKMLYKARCQLSMQMYPTNKKGVMKLYKFLKTGGVTAILPDQSPDPEGGRFAPFFGIPALTPVLVSRLIGQSEAMCLVFACMRDKRNGRYRIAYQKPDPEIYHQDLDTSLAAMNRSIMTIVNSAPEQYQWEYKRFKKRPEDQPRIY